MADQNPKEEPVTTKPIPRPAGGRRGLAGIVGAVVLLISYVHFRTGARHSDAPRDDPPQRVGRESDRGKVTQPARRKRARRREI